MHRTVRTKKWTKKGTLIDSTWAPLHLHNVFRFINNAILIIYALVSPATALFPLLCCMPGLAKNIKMVERGRARE